MGNRDEDLNATLLQWPPGHVVAEHLNDACDVLLVVVEEPVARRSTAFRTSWPPRATS